MDRVSSTRFDHNDKDLHCRRTGMEGLVLLLVLVFVIETHSYVAVPRSTKAWSLHVTSTNNGSLSFILEHDIIQPLLLYSMYCTTYTSTTYIKSPTPALKAHYLSNSFLLAISIY